MEVEDTLMTVSELKSLDSMKLKRQAVAADAEELYAVLFKLFNLIPVILPCVVVLVGHLTAVFGLGPESSFSLASSYCARGIRLSIIRDFESRPGISSSSSLSATFSEYPSAES